MSNPVPTFLFAAIASGFAVIFFIGLFGADDTQTVQYKRIASDAQEVRLGLFDRVKQFLASLGVQINDTTDWAWLPLLVIVPPVIFFFLGMTFYAIASVFLAVFIAREYTQYRLAAYSRQYMEELPQAILQFLAAYRVSRSVLSAIEEASKSLGAPYNNLFKEITDIARRENSTQKALQIVSRYRPEQTYQDFFAQLIQCEVNGLKDDSGLRSLATSQARLNAILAEIQAAQRSSYIARLFAVITPTAITVFLALTTGIYRDFLGSPIGFVAQGLVIGGSVLVWKLIGNIAKRGLYLEDNMMQFKR